MLDPILPARISEIIVGENSKIVLDCVIYPTVYEGKSGLSILEAVCKAITPPIKADIKITMGIELIPIIWISLNKLLQNMDHFLGRVNIMRSIKKYFPIEANDFISLN